MSEQNQPIDISDDIEVVGPGQMLRDAREAKGLSQKDVATHLNFRHALVNELETEAFDSATPSTFIRGYLRNYAKFLGINEKEILESYETLGVARQQRAEMKSFSRVTAKKAENKLLMATSTVIALLMIGFSAYHFILEDKSAATDTPLVQSTENDATDIESAPTGSSLAETEQQAAADEMVSFSDAPVQPSTASVNLSMVTEENQQSQALSQPEQQMSAENETESQLTQPVVETSQEQPPQEPGEGSDVATASESDSAPEDTAVTAQIPVSTAAEESTLALAPVKDAQLNFVFSGDCWVNIFDADGNRLAWGIKKNDYVMTLTGKPPFSVTLGKPELVQMTYQGEEISLSQFKVGQIAKLTVPEPVEEEAAE